MIESKRELDEALTRKVEQYMDTVYKNAGWEVHRNTDAKTQRLGKDFELDDKIVDEKFAIDYRMKDLNTYSFEVWSGNNKDERGWFVNPKSITTHYLLLWFKSDKDINKITSYTAALISKKKLIKYLESIGVDIDNEIYFFNSYWKKPYPSPRFHSDENKKSEDIKAGIRMVQSFNKKECPINMIIPKEILLKVADKVLSN